LVESVDEMHETKPYPKRVIIFSPHPDDDVISMGGTLRRLVEQKHEVYSHCMPNHTMPEVRSDRFHCNPYLLISK